MRPSRGIHGISETRSLRACVFGMALLACVAAGCSTSKTFTREVNDYERQQVRTLPFDYDTVWKSTIYFLRGSDYRLHTNDQKNGMIMTWWRSRIMNESGAIPQNREYQRGVKVEDRSDGDLNEKAQFMVRNRLEIRMMRDTDSTTTVIVWNIMRVAPTDYMAGENTPEFSSTQIISYVEFDTHEEYKVLDEIAGEAARRKH
jgi:uncharacterized lipoprotein